MSEQSTDSNSSFSHISNSLDSLEGSKYVVPRRTSNGDRYTSDLQDGTGVSSPVPIPNSNSAGLNGSMSDNSTDDFFHLSNSSDFNNSIDRNGSPIRSGSNAVPSSAHSLERQPCPPQTRMVVQKPVQDTASLPDLRAPQSLDPRNSQISRKSLFNQRPKSCRDNLANGTESFQPLIEEVQHQQTTVESARVSSNSRPITEAYPRQPTSARSNSATLGSFDAPDNSFTGARFQHPTAEYTSDSASFQSMSTSVDTQNASSLPETSRTDSINCSLPNSPVPHQQLTLGSSSSSSFLNGSLYSTPSSSILDLTNGGGTAMPAADTDRSVFDYSPIAASPQQPDVEYTSVELSSEFYVVAETNSSSVSPDANASLISSYHPSTGRCIGEEPPSNPVTVVPPLSPDNSIGFPPPLASPGEFSNNPVSEHLSDADHLRMLTPPTKSPDASPDNQPRAITPRLIRHRRGPLETKSRSVSDLSSISSSSSLAFDLASWKNSVGNWSTLNTISESSGSKSTTDPASTSSLYDRNSTTSVSSEQSEDTQTRVNIDETTSTHEEERLLPGSDVSLNARDFNIRFDAVGRQFIAEPCTGELRL